MSSTSLTALPATRSRQRHLYAWFLLLALLIGFAGWGYVLMRLTSASHEGIDAFENRIRQGLVQRGYLPRSYRHWYPDHQDLIKHFVFYAPFGLMAGMAGSVVLLSPRGAFSRHVTVRRAAVALVGVGIALSTVDEIRQIWIPTRSAEISDLLAGWAGIAFAFLLWKLGERGTLLLLPRRMRPAPEHRP